MKIWTKSSSDSSHIPVLVPSVPKYKSVSKNVKKIDKSRIYSNFGPLNKCLIKRASEYLSVPSKLIQTASNATVDIEGVRRTSGVIGGTWEVPSWTFVETASTLLNSNSNGKFVDVYPLSWRANFSSDAKNVIDVLSFGSELDLARIPKRARCVVVDAAASIHALKNCQLSFDRPET